MPASAVEVQRDEETARAVTHLPGGTKVQNLTGVQYAAVEATEDLPEPVTFTRPRQPNGAVMGSLYMEAPGVYVRRKERPIWFRAGHAVARTTRDLERLTAACGKQCFTEPSPAEIKRQGLKPLEFKDQKGRVQFWSYLQEAFQQFHDQYMRDRA